MKLVLKLEYKCYPVWIYDDIRLIDNDLPKNTINYIDVDKMLCELQDEFDNTFIDDGKIFENIGFSDEKRNKLVLLVESVIVILEKQFNVENYINL